MRVTFAMRNLMLLPFLLLAMRSHAFLLPDNDPWEHWRPAAQTASLKLDHSAWAQLLQRYVNANHASGINRFDYATFTNSDAERLNKYITYLTLQPIAKLTVLQQQALWINLYNALTIQLIIENRGIESIREIKDGLFSFGPWDRELVVIDTKAITLNDIEHRILRPLYGDYRVHFAVNCASLGCPNLATVPFTADTLDDMLNKGASDYINHPRGVTVEGDKLTLSTLFKWYREDFGQDSASVVQRLAQHAKPDLAQRMERYQGRISYQYDWALNKP